jgi:hypothetical protein
METMPRGGRLLAFFVVAARFAGGPERWWCLERAGCRSRLRPCRHGGASRSSAPSGARIDPGAAGRLKMMGLPSDNLVIKVRAIRQDCLLPRCLCTWVEPDGARMGGAGYALVVLATPRARTAWYVCLLHTARSERNPSGWRPLSAGRPSDAEGSRAWGPVLREICLRILVCQHRVNEAYLSSIFSVCTADGRDIVCSLEECCLFCISAPSGATGKVIAGAAR